MIARHLRRLAAVLAFVLALVLLTASLLLSLQRIKEAHESALGATGISLWLTTQAEFELQRLIGALDRFALDGGEVDREQLTERFEIFWSRVPLLAQGDDSEVIAATGEASALVEAILEELRAIEPMLEGLVPGSHAEYRELRGRLVVFREPLRDLTLAVDHELSRAHGILDRRLEALYAGHMLQLIAVLAGAGLLIALLAREALRTRRLLAEADRARERIQHLAGHDPLTDLPNRALFADRLGRALADARRRGRKVAILSFDIDRFKPINDSWGHAVGDALLVELARRTLACVRAVDTVARLGGDELAIVQSDIGRGEDAGALAERLLEAMRPPFELEPGALEATISIGIAMFPDDGADMDTLLRSADLALYRAKQEGRGRYRFFTPEMQARSQARRQLEQGLRRAVEEHAFKLHLQPIVALGDRRPIAAEALLRWPQPAGGLEGPEAFLAVAEAARLMPRIGEWVLQRACRAAAGWTGEARIAVNLGAGEIAAPELPERVRTALRRSCLPPERLQLEVSELVLEGLETLEPLEILRALGVGIALDDFGARHGSLVMLAGFPFDVVKLDHRVVHALGRGGEGEALARAVATIARDRPLEVVGEAVETPDQLASLEALGCHAAQGRLLGAPRCAAGCAPDWLDRPTGPPPGNVRDLRAPGRRA